MAHRIRCPPVGSALARIVSATAEKSAEEVRYVPVFVSISKSERGRPIQVRAYPSSFSLSERNIPSICSTSPRQPTCHSRRHRRPSGTGRGGRDPPPRPPQGWTRPRRLRGSHPRQRTRLRVSPTSSVEAFFEDVFDRRTPVRPIDRFCGVVVLDGGDAEEIDLLE
jgi:hypothetical protein